MSENELSSEKQERPRRTGLPLEGFRGYALAIICVLVGWGLRAALDPIWGDQLPFGSFFLAELVVAQFAGLGPLLVTIVAGFFLGDWFFIAPRHSLAIADRVVRFNALLYCLLSFAVFFIVLRTRWALVRWKRAEEERERLVDDLKAALANVKTLTGLLPICASCKKIRDDKGYWNQLEVYIHNHSDAKFTHGICPDCARKLYPSAFEDEASPGPGGAI